jgi:haloalkane dehalogenase
MQITNSMSKSISTEFPFESKYLNVKGSKIHYIDEGEGDPILFLHGNPMSNYLWRNIIPYLTKQGRCIAPDLIGMGKSSKPDINYGFQDSFDYLNSFIEQLGLKNVTLVLHDWGSGLGFHYANTHQENVKAIVFMEAMYDAPTTYDMPASIRIALKMMRTPVLGWFMVQVANVFIKKMIPDMILRKMTKTEMDYYASPYPTIKSRKPLLKWPLDVPFNNGNPKEVAKAVSSWHTWLMDSEIPKLFFYVSPGVAIKKKDVKIIKERMRNLESIDLGEGLHFIQEDYPHEIGNGISKWYDEIK